MKSFYIATILCLLLNYQEIVFACSNNGVLISCTEGKCCSYEQQVKTIFKEVDMLKYFKEICLNNHQIIKMNWCDGNPSTPSVCPVDLITDPCTGEILQYPVGFDMSNYGTTNLGSWKGVECKKHGSNMRVIEFKLSEAGVECDLNHVDLTRFSLLKKIDLDENKIFGSVPEYFGFFKGLQRLDLAYNSLTGTIPFELGYGKVLSSVDLSHNHITGSLPTSMIEELPDGTTEKNMRRLSRLRLKGTKIQHVPRHADVHIRH